MISMKDLLGLMAPTLLREKPTISVEEKDRDLLLESEKMICPLDRQQRFVEILEKAMYEEDGVYHSAPCEVSDYKELYVEEYNFFLMYVYSTEWTDSLSMDELNIKGFNTLDELKVYLEETNIILPTIHIYVKDLKTYKEVRFKGYYDTDEHIWTDIEIPCLCELEQIEFERGKDFITIPCALGLFPNVNFVEEYLTFIIAEGYFEKGIEFMVEGDFKYEDKKYYYKISSNGMNLKLDYCLPH